jgi:hypothetical protein
MLALKQGLSLNTIKTLGGGGAAFSNVYSLDFDGVDDYVNFGDADVFSINSSGANRGFSLSCWIKTTGGQDEIISKLDGSNLEFVVFGDNNGSVAQGLKLNTPIVGDNNWHHVAVSFDLADASTSLSLFVDGVEYNDTDAGAAYSSSGTWAAAANTSAPLNMGRRGTNSWFYEGNIDEVAIFDNVMTAAQATAIYNSGTPTDLSGESNLVGYWRNGDTAGTSVYPTIEDYSSNSNDGTMTNMVSGDIVTVVP